MTVMHLEQANETSLHLLVQNHPESDKEAVYSCVDYIAGNYDIEEITSEDLLSELYQWQTRPKPQFCQQWQKGTLVMCNNSSVLHRASIGGMK